jgi:hypothetical protein
MNISYQIVYWREIPAQIKVRSGRQRISRPLSSRFQEAIDAAAMHSQATSADAYLDDWRSSDWQEGEGDPDSLADSLVARMEAEYPAERLEALRMNKGYDGVR